MVNTFHDTLLEIDEVIETIQVSIRLEMNVFYVCASSGSMPLLF